MLKQLARIPPDMNTPVVKKALLRGELAEFVDGK
jgi:hypothetical protein